MFCLNVFTMKKVFMSFAVVALMVAAVACGNKAKKAEVVEETVEAVADSCCVADSCNAACVDTVAAETVVAE